MKPLKLFFQRIKKQSGSLQMPRRFLLYYLLLIFLPMLIFFAWYSRGLVRERQNEQRYEYQLMLDHSAEFFSSFLQQSNFVYDTLQSNTALLNMMENNLYSVSEEVVTYQTQIKPTISSILSANSVIDEIFIYRHVPSQTLNNANMIYYVQAIGDFTYPGHILEALETAGSSYDYLALDETEVRRKDMDSFSPELILFYNIYGRDYSKVIGVLEVQLDLNHILRALDFVSGKNMLYMRYGDLYYPISFDGKQHFYSPDSQPQPDIPVSAKSGAQILTAKVKNTDLELYASFDLEVTNWQQILNYIAISFSILLLPTILFCVIIYRYAARLMRFSRHIRHSGKNGLTSYEVAARTDEIGTVIREYNQMIDSLRHAEQLKNDANYYALSSQINPHFIFNTLENVRMRIELEKYTEASDMLFVLSRFFRYNISLRRESTLLDELTHIQNYLQIYHYRQNKSICFTVDIPEHFVNFRCPFCILQPIVENSMRHGKKMEEVLWIAVSVSEAGELVYVDIFDDGKGMSGDDVKKLNERLNQPPSEEISTGGSVGLANVNERLKYFYGERGGLTFIKEPNGLTCRAAFVCTNFETAGKGEAKK